MKVVSLLDSSPPEAQARFASLLDGQCWARFAEGFVPAPYGATPTEAEILKVVLPVLDRCAEALPRPGELSAVLLPQGNLDPYSRSVRQQMFGVSGLTAGADLIALRVGQEPGWQAALADATAHEYHHAAWVSLRPDIDRSIDLPLAEHLAFEGRACVFAEQITGGWAAPWTRELNDPAFETRVRTALAAGLNVPADDADPPWWVYRWGTAWVRESLETRPELSTAEWTQASAEELFRVLLGEMEGARRT